MIRLDSLRDLSPDGVKLLAEFGLAPIGVTHLVDPGRGSVWVHLEGFRHASAVPSRLVPAPDIQPEAQPS